MRNLFLFLLFIIACCGCRKGPHPTAQPLTAADRVEALADLLADTEDKDVAEMLYTIAGTLDNPDERRTLGEALLIATIVQQEMRMDTLFNVVGENAARIDSAAREIRKIRVNQ